MTRSRVFLLVFAWALFPFSAQAEFMGAATEAHLTAKARAEGLTRVLVVLDVDVSLDDMKSGAKRAAIAEHRGRVLAGLAHHEHVPEAVWDSGLGQLSLLVNEAGLRRLAALPGVRDVQVDTSEDQRLGVFDGDGRVTAIRQALEQTRNAAVRIHYTDGRVVERNIDLREFHLLKEARDVRALALAGQEPPGTRIDPRILAEAAKGGDVVLGVELAVPEHFSPMRSKLPPEAWDAQAREFDAIAARFAQEHALANVPALRGMPGFGVVVTSEQARNLVAELAARPDPQVYAVKVADLLDPMVGQSTVYIGMPNAWNAGYEATGQFVVVLDTGVDSSHPYLAEKVAYEGCFGTNTVDASGNPLWRGDCLNQDALGNSPLPTPGAGAPCAGNADKCGHGTHVAGIAASRNGMTRGQAAHGVARAAQLAAIRIFSRNVQTGDVGIFEPDVWEALNALVNTLPTDAFTLNFSVSRNNFRSLSTCVDGQFTAWATDNLRDRRIPTVASVGNDAALGFAWPACIGSIVKVMSMCSINDPIGEPCTPGEMSTTITNFADPAMFGGPTFVAPGNSIISSWPGNLLAQASGTSQAAPHVSGLYAAVKAAVPGVAVADVTAWIQANAVGMPHPQMPGITYRRIRVP